MHHFIFPTSDAWISSGSSNIDGTSFKDQNFGRDQILEVKKEFYNSSFDYQTRALINFAGTDFTSLSSSISSGDITSPIFYLRLYEAEGNSDLSTTYKLLAQPISQSWDEGRGKFGDDPKVTNGVSWENRNYPDGGAPVQWISQTAVGNGLASGIILLTDGTNFSNQEYSIGGVDFVFVSGSTSVFDNSSTQLFVQASTSPITTAARWVAVINNSSSLHGLPITASAQSAGSNGQITLHATSTGTIGNLSAASSSATGFTTNGDAAFALQGGSDTLTSSFIGNGPSVYSISSSVQSFSYESPDVEMDITSMVNTWLTSSYDDGGIDNYGLLLRFSGSQETNDTTFGKLKFFSKDTHTIYAPKLEVRWDDHLPCTGSNTGSLNQITMSGAADNYLYMKNLQESYKESDKVKFRVGARKQFIQKNFSTSVQTTSGSFIPEDSGSYSIVDMATGETVIPFSDYTKLSCDSTSNYFIQWLNGFYPNRAYKILFKLKYDDSQEQIFDNNFEFIVRK